MRSRGHHSRFGSKRQTTGVECGMRPIPKLRPVEAFPIEHGGQRVFVVSDPTGLADGPITVSPPAMFVLMMFDGRKGLEDVQDAFAEQFGRPIPSEQLEDLVSQLDAAHYLDSEDFARRYRSLVAAYKDGPARVCRDLSAYGIDGPAEGDAGDGDVAGRLKAVIGETLGGNQARVVGQSGRRVVGLIAPHLDFGRGAPCYADAYGVLAAAGAVRRVVILGTNHFGRASSVVATSKDFQTPLGTTRTDRAFLNALQARCGVDLTEHEFDHVREHSVELQVLMLQHLWGAGSFEMVAALCHDPCGPTGTAPYDGRGVDLAVFGAALGELIRADDTPTLIVAGADLSHIGRRFGDECELTPAFLADVERKDRAAIGEIVAGHREGFLQVLTEHDNSTRVCSAGCIYALRVALDGAKGELLRYHQAVDAPGGTCVTCCAAAFWQ